jgi:hypothetical protein
MAPSEPRRYPLLGLVAYVLVPGERRVRAARHFRRAGIEALRGLGALAILPSGPEAETSVRERIEIE